MPKLPWSWLKFCLCLGLVLLLSLHSTCAIAAPQANTGHRTEIRGVWLTNVASSVLFWPQGVQRAMRQLSRLNFNTVYPVVWNRGYTTYPSHAAESVMGHAEMPFLRSMRLGQNLLSSLVRQGHRYNLRVIPWFEYGFMVPLHSPLAKQHPDWLTVYRDGTQRLRAGVAEPIVPNSPQSLNGNQGLKFWQRFQKQFSLSNQLAWLNPLHPEVQDLLLDLVAEVVSQYPVDGIQFDDHFSLPVELGYDPFTLELYQQEHNGQLPPDDPFEPEWMQWRASKLSDVMRRIYRTVKRIKPDCLVSLSPNSQSFAYRFYLQDWPFWIQQGWLDELVLQTYRDDLDRFITELKQPAVHEARQHIPVGIGILTGTWGHPISIAQIQQQVRLVRDFELDGVSFFYWESLWGYITPEAPRERRSAFQTLFAGPAA